MNDEEAHLESPRNTLESRVNSNKTFRKLGRSCSRTSSCRNAEISTDRKPARLSGSQKWMLHEHREVKHD